MKIISFHFISRINARIKGEYKKKKKKKKKNKNKTKNKQNKTNNQQKCLADVISVIAMTATEGKRSTLKYKFLGSNEAVDLWGHEYVRFGSKKKKKKKIKNKKNKKMKNEKNEK